MEQLQQQKRQLPLLLDRASANKSYSNAQTRVTHESNDNRCPQNNHVTWQHRFFHLYQVVNAYFKSPPPLMADAEIMCSP